MSAFDEWKAENCIVELRGTGVQTCWTDWKLQQAFNAGRDSLVSQRECYQRGYAAGKKAGMEVEDE